MRSFPLFDSCVKYFYPNSLITPEENVQITYHNYNVWREFLMKETFDKIKINHIFNFWKIISVLDQLTSLI